MDDNSWRLFPSLGLSSHSTHNFSLTRDSSGLSPKYHIGFSHMTPITGVHQFLIRFLLLHISGVPLTRITLGMLYTLCFSYRNRLQLHASSQWEYSHPLPFGLTSPAREWWNAIPLSTWLSSQITQLHKLSHPSKPSYVGFLKLLSWFLNYFPATTFKNN